MKLGILNTSIATENGCYKLHPLTLEEAQYIAYVAMNKDGIDSAIGLFRAENLNHANTSGLDLTLSSSDIDSF